MRKILLVFGLILGLYLFGRAIAEPFMVNLADPSQYRHDWGGPSLLGVLAVHCGPGLVAGALMVTALIRRYGRPPIGSPTPSGGSDRPGDSGPSDGTRRREAGLPARGQGRP